MRFTRPSLSAALAVIAVYAAVVFYSAWYLRTEIELPGACLTQLALLVLTGIVTNCVAQRSAPRGLCVRLPLTALVAFVAAGAMFIRSGGSLPPAPTDGPGELVIVAWLTLAVFTLALPAVLIPNCPPDAARSSKNSALPE